MAFAWLIELDAAIAHHTTCPTTSEIDAESLVTALGKPSGLLLIFRHGVKEMNGRRDRDIPLSDVGEAQATIIGQSLASLDVKLSTMVVSPYVRTKQTATLISEGWGSAAPAWTEKNGLQKKGASVEKFKEVISGLQPNFAVISHRGNITLFLAEELPGTEETKLACGEATVLQRLEQGGYQCLARILPEEWCMIGETAGTPCDQALMGRAKESLLPLTELDKRCGSHAGAVRRSTN